MAKLQDGIGKVIKVDITFYFYNNYLLEEFEAYLLQHMKSITASNGGFIYTAQEESEEGEGDTFYVKCDYFSFNTSLFNVNNISRDYRLEINYALECVIYEAGEEKFLEFVGNILRSSDGDALLLKDSEYRILERRNGFIIVDHYFFHESYKALNLPYEQGKFKKYLIQISSCYTTDEIMCRIREIVTDWDQQIKLEIIEDPSYPDEFVLNLKGIQVIVVNIKTSINISCSQIFRLNRRDELEVVLSIFKELITKFNGDFVLSKTEGYWEQEKSVLVESKDGKKIINEQAIEARFLHEINF